MWKAADERENAAETASWNREISRKPQKSKPEHEWREPETGTRAHVALIAQDADETFLAAKAGESPGERSAEQNEAEGDKSGIHVLPESKLRT